MSPQTIISAAMSEIVRVAWWGLRGLGCPVGAVEAMARVLSYSEVLDGHTLAALRDNEERLLAAFKSEQPHYRATGEASGLIDASGHSMLNIGPRAIDLITGLAKREGRPVRIAVRRLADTIGIAGAATVAAKRGMGLLVICGKVRRGWRFYAATRAGEVISIEGNLDGLPVDDLMDLLQETAGPQFKPETPFQKFAEPDDPAYPDGLTLELFAFPFEAIDAFPLRAARRPGVTCKHVSQILHDAYANGVEVRAEDLRFLYELETRTWAPSSERSRMQAGFQVAAPIT
jgi:hypothetical protein